MSKVYVENTANRVAFEPIKAVMNGSIASSATFPEFGEMIPFFGVCCIANSLYVSVVFLS
jgi:hypothetical protein